MAEKNFLVEMGVSEEAIDKEIDNLFEQYPGETLTKLYEKSFKEVKPNTIIKGRVVNIRDDEVIIDIGYKSDGIISLAEFDNPAEVKTGDEIEVFLDAVENEVGLVVLSKGKADRIRGWEKIITTYKEGDAVKGRVIRKTKGGLLVNIGMPVFLPASQVDIRRIDDIGRLMGKEIDAKIIKIDPERMSIVISRRRFLDDQRLEQRVKLLAELKEGDIRDGIVKNIADFGVFIDLGGIDGLLHITDMAWRRVSHPSEIVRLDQTLKIKVLKLDPATGRVTVGLKQLSPDPWEKVEQKYSTGSHIKGKVVNILPYGAFVEVESGVEGLLHISEMSWTKRISHPSEMVAIGDFIEAVVLNVNASKRELALGMKQMETNPWTNIETKYPTGTRIQGRVRNLTTYGVFIEIEEGVDGLLHLSDISWTRTAVKPAEVIKKGDKIEVVVLSVDSEKKRVSLGVKQLTPNPWETIIPEKYSVGAVVPGKILKLTKIGTIIELEPAIEGIMLASKAEDEAAAGAAPQFKPDDQIKVEITKLEPSEGKITLKLSQSPAPDSQDTKSAT